MSIAFDNLVIGQSYVVHHAFMEIMGNAMEDRTLYGLPLQLLGINYPFIVVKVNFVGGNTEVLPLDIRRTELSSVNDEYIKAFCNNQVIGQNNETQKPRYLSSISM